MKKSFYLIMILLAGAVLFTQCKKEEPVEKTTISGQITNSQTGLPLGNVTLSFCKPFNPATTSNPQVVFTVTTNATTGQYTTDQAIVGTYTLMLTATNFFTLYIDNFVVASGITNNVFQPITLVQTLGSSLLRIVLTWGSTPSDLDSHLTGPTVAGSSTRFHVYYSNDTYNPSSSITPIIILDTDDTSSYGPETTTINSWTAGTYRYSVFNYSDQSVSGGATIKTSPATVQIYGPTGILKTYTPPAFTANGGNTWVVFEITATANGTYTITDKNVWANSTSSEYVTKK